jgi:hypothetical protein
MKRNRWIIECKCGHTFTRATICRKDLRTWGCPRKARNVGVRHDTSAQNYFHASAVPIDAKGL